MFGRLAGVAAQSSEDAARLASLGAPPPTVVGNIKFDVTIAEEMIELGKGLRLRFGPSRPVWIAGSTREGEEALILDAMARRPLSRETLLVIVPRHPQRFAAVADMLGDGFEILTHLDPQAAAARAQTAQLAPHDSYLVRRR